MVLMSGMEGDKRLNSLHKTKERAFTSKIRRLGCGMLTLWLCLGSLGAAPSGAAALLMAETEPPAFFEDDESQEMTYQELTREDAELGAIVDDPLLGVREKLDRILKSYATMGGSIAVIENGAITFTHVYGQRQRDGEAVTQETLFQVGSISKMVAGMGVMQLVEQGQIDLDEDLGKALGFPLRNPQYPDTPITLRQVMSHTAGLRDSGYYREALAGKARPLPELFSPSRASYLFLKDVEAGAREQYSNFGGGLAGCVIEHLSGQTIDAYMKEHVFAPLSIIAGYQAAQLPQGVPLADMYAMPGRRATKVLLEDPTNITQPDSQRDYYFTAGKLIISAPDLAKLVIALCDGGMYQDVRILKESSAAEMRTLQNRRGSVTGHSGRGLYMNIIVNDQVEGRTMYGHGGKANGMLCAAYFDPRDRTGVVMLTNGCNNRKVYRNVGMLGRAVMRICYQELIEPTHVAEDPFLVE